MGWDGEVCKCCDREQRLAWLVQDYLWAEVIDGRFNVVCLECFVAIAEKKNIKVTLGDIWFQGIIQNLEG